MKKRNRLYGLLAEQSIGQAEFAKMIGRSLWYVSFRLTGKEPWTTDEVHQIIKLFGIPMAEAMSYFPPTTGATNAKRN